MNDFRTLLHNVSTSTHYHGVHKMTQLLSEHFGVNHFWYYKTTNEGQFSYFGTHLDWSHYCIDQNMIKDAPNICHPSTHPLGINFIGSCTSEGATGIVDDAWDKFKINFNLNLTSKVKNGVESFGFATKHRDAAYNQYLLNNLPLLQSFIKVFKESNSKFFKVVDENSINVAQKFGDVFYNRKKIITPSTNRSLFMKKLGIDVATDLTRSEVEIMKLLVYGYPATFIAKEINLSRKTVENYLASIKSKLNCNTKVELIQKARLYSEIGYFD